MSAEQSGALLDPEAAIGSAENMVAVVKRMEGNGKPRAISRVATYAGAGSTLDTRLTEWPVFGENLVGTSPTLWLVGTQIQQTAGARRVAAERCADELEHDAMFLSTMRRAETIPAYRHLRPLLPEALAVALQRLGGPSQPLWLFFLQEVTGQRPAKGAADAAEAAELWRRWARERRFAR